jgi:hypothetical protein
MSRIIAWAPGPPSLGGGGVNCMTKAIHTLKTWGGDHSPVAMFPTLLHSIPLICAVVTAIMFIYTYSLINILLFIIQYEIYCYMA